MIQVELNVTLACQSRCACCDRLCDLFPKRTDHMTVEQVNAFVTDAKQHGGVTKVRVLGGEPTLHPQIDEVLNILTVAIVEGVIGAIEINTNTLVRGWKEIRSRHSQPGIRWDKSPVKRKNHLPFLWSPRDLGFKTMGPCRHPVQCGFSLDVRGWLPCSPTIAISRAFYDGKHYRQEFPDGTPWGCEDLCPHCVYSMPRRWRKRNTRKVLDFTKAMKTPTPSWAKAIERLQARGG